MEEEITSIVRQLIISSRQDPPGLKKRSTPVPSSTGEAVGGLCIV